MDDSAGDILRAFGFMNLDFFLSSTDFGEDVALDFLFGASEAAASGAGVIAGAGAT
ncbi:MAG: hypothetical protein HC767_01275 [Akkermansiaceae bacterium]|nr:hypothetical protein [Akkermansiaceae bacterium]